MTIALDASTLPASARGLAGLFTLMACQHGVASTRQARRLGVSRSVEQRLVREGAAVVVAPGVLMGGGVPVSFAVTAMAAALRPGVAAVSHGTAARLHRLAGFERYALIDVVGDRGAHLHLDPPVITHYTRGPIGADLVRVGAIPVTSIPLTLALIASTAGRIATSRALADAIARGVPVAAIRAVAERWRGPGRPGPALVLSLLGSLAQR